jgi:hypothetical protein
MAMRMNAGSVSTFQVRGIPAYRSRPNNNPIDKIKSINGETTIASGSSILGK